MRSGVLVYISGPMTAKNGHTIEENVAAGVRVYLDLLQRGIPAFSPHLSGAFPSAWADVSWDAWIAYDFAVIRRCTHMLMMPRWIESAGAAEEYKFAATLKMPVAMSLAELLLVLGDEPAQKAAQG